MKVQPRASVSLIVGPFLAQLRTQVRQLTVRLMTYRPASVKA
jgi:hypothetical protein